MRLHPLSMFMEKSDGDGVQRFSMTRLVALLFAVTVCRALLIYAHAPKELNWPFVALGIVTLLAVPLQALCRFLQQWFASSPGQAVLAKCMDKLTAMLDDRRGH